MKALDSNDLKILSLLQENSRYPLKYLSEQVQLSSPAISTRIERLEKSGLIEGYSASIDPASLGFKITAFINLSLEPYQKAEFYPFIESCPNVLECNCVTGPYSMLMKVAFPSTPELDQFINQLQVFGKTETQIVFSTAVKPRGISMSLVEALANESEDED
jgi:Lrp/AsnC family leucine-responsive transcriptional regulator